MTRLEKLIQELCPDGVKYLPIPELFITRNGYTPSKANNEFWDNGTIPWFRMENIRENGRILTTATQYVSKKAVKGKLFPADSIIIATSATIGEHALIKVPSLANQRFTYLTLKDEFKDCVDMMFVFYYCFRLDEYCKSHLNQGNFASVDMKQFAAFKFPVPPLPVQREIVRILDNFTWLTAELTAELTARKKQYAYYRDKLLTFGDARVGVTSDVIRRTLGEVCKISAGGDAPKDSMSKQKTEKYSVPIISNGIGENALYGYTDAPKVEEPAVTVAARGTIGYAEYRDYPFYPIIRLLTAIPKDSTVVNTKYLYYCLQGKQYSVPMGGIPQLTAPELKKVEIPIPSLDVQNRIVQVLDNFDAICTDLFSGLPAEIEARQKQYEYYRDKLLTFKEKTS